jgi:hypothetical protein
LKGEEIRVCPKIACLDIDGVCANIAQAFAPAAKACGYQSDLDYTRYWMGIPADLRVPVQNYMFVSGMIQKLPAYPDAVTAVRQLQNAGHEVVYVTARGHTGLDRGFKEAIELVTREWLIDNGFLITRDPLFTIDKVGAVLSIGASLMVEDCLETAESFRSTPARCVFWSIGHGMPVYTLLLVNMIIRGVLNHLPSFRRFSVS